MKRLIIIGAGGHAKVVADSAIACGFEVLGFMDDKRKKGENIIGDLKVLGSISETQEIAKKDDFFIVAIGDNGIRKTVFDSLREIKAAVIIHPSAVVSQYSKIGEGSVVLANAVISAGSVIGNNCIINALSLIDHETVIGSHSHIAQGSIIGSNCSLPEVYTTQPGQNIASFTKI